MRGLRRAARPETGQPLSALLVFCAFHSRYAMLQELRIFLTAVQYFTRIPVPAWVGHSSRQLEDAARYFPLAGVLVGGAAGAALWLAAQVLPLPVAVVLSMSAGILVTGAFHEDGLSDFADGLGAGADRERMLAIMKDSRTGVYGVLSLVLVLLLKYQALLFLCSTHSLRYLAAVLIAAHAVSRLMAASIMLTQRYVRFDDSARAKPAAQQLGYANFAVALITCLAMLGVLLLAGANPGSIALACLGALLMRGLLARQLRKRLGGYTGDGLGAVQQLSEVAFYLGLLAAF